MTLLPNTTLDHAQHLAAACARRTMNTWHVLDDRGHLLIADDADAAAWGDRAIWSIEPEQAFSASEMGSPPFDDPLPTDGPGDPIPGDVGYPLLADVHNVLSQCLSNQRMVAIVPEIERVLHRVEQALCARLMATA